MVRHVRGARRWDPQRTVLRAGTERPLGRLRILAAPERHDPDFDPSIARQHDLLVATMHELIVDRGPDATPAPSDEIRLHEKGLDDDVIG